MNHNDVADITVDEINQLRSKITALELELSHCRESGAKLEAVARLVVKRAAAVDETKFWEYRGVLTRLGKKAQRALGMVE